MAEPPDPPPARNDGDPPPYNSSSPVACAQQKQPELFTLMHELRALEQARAAWGAPGSGEVERAAADEREALAVLGALKSEIMAHVDARRQRLSRQMAALTQKAARLRLAADYTQLFALLCALLCLAADGAARVVAASDPELALKLLSAPILLSLVQAMALVALRFRNVQGLGDEIASMIAEAGSVLAALNEHREAIGSRGAHADIAQLWSEIERRCQSAANLASRFDALTVRIGRRYRVAE